MTDKQQKAATAVTHGADLTSTNPEPHGSRMAAAARGAVAKLLSGDGWTTAVTLDDAFAGELLQTWSLPGEREGDNDSGTDGPITDLRTAPLLI
jgi:hypothetical protein